MKGFKKSTRIAYWFLRALAISSALLLFSIIGIVALQPATHASGLVISAPTTTAGITSSPADSTTPTPTMGITPTVTDTPTPSPTPSPTPTTQPTQPPPTQTPVPNPTKTPGMKPTATPTVSTGTPIVGATPTSAAIGPALPPATQKGTPTVTPSPTPSGSPTTNTGGTPIATSSNGNGGNPSSTIQPNSDGGMMAKVKQFMVPIAGASTAVLLGSVGLLGLMAWRKRTATQGATPAFAQASGPAQPTELAPAQNRAMPPFAMQSIVQYSPFLGAPDTSQLDAPAPASDFRPLPIDYPQIMEVHTDKTRVPITPAELQSLSPTRSAELQLASIPFSPLPGAVEASPMPSSKHTTGPQPQQNAPVAYQFPEQDPLLENLMQQAQMGIFALPGKGA